MDDADGQQHWIFWDGDCGLCRRAVAWIKRSDRRDSFRPTPFQKAPSPPMTPALRAACENAVHVVTSEGRVLRAGRAVLFILDHIGKARLFARVFSLPPLVYLVEIGYRILAVNRPFFSRFLFTKE